MKPVPSLLQLNAPPVNLTGKVVVAYDENDLLDVLKGVRAYPAVGIVYEGMRSMSEEGPTARVGLSCEIVLAFVLVERGDEIHATQPEEGPGHRVSRCDAVSVHGPAQHGDHPLLAFHGRGPSGSSDGRCVLGTTMVSPRSNASPTPSGVVSCILPTKNRAAFIPQAIQSYQSQTYPHRELIIVDNGNDQTESLIPDDPTIRYVRISKPQTTGDMRNLCASYATGEFICHFDSDDWSAPERVTDQITRLGVFGVLTGYHSMLFYDVRSRQCYRWTVPTSMVRYALGTSLCYRRVWWEQHPFRPLRVGEDTRFFQQACREARRLVPTAAADQLMVARVHDQQTSRKTLTRTSYQHVPVSVLPKLFPCGSI